ncbi:unnamed protein product [Symbiodinium sp. CCMP2592]|nr:unnamed protein product [Symbiodinium sp. CCMP2592]
MSAVWPEAEVQMAPGGLLANGIRSGMLRRRRTLGASAQGNIQGSKRQGRRQEEDTSPGPYGPTAQKTNKVLKPAGLLDGTWQLNQLSLLNSMPHSNYSKRRRRSRTAARWREVTLRKLRRKEKHRD